MNDKCILVGKWLILTLTCLFSTDNHDFPHAPPPYSLWIAMKFVKDSGVVPLPSPQFWNSTFLLLDWLSSNAREPNILFCYLNHKYGSHFEVIIKEDMVIMGERMYSLKCISLFILFKIIDRAKDREIWFHVFPKRHW